MAKIQYFNGNKVLLTEFNDMVIICRENYRQYNLYIYNWLQIFLWTIIIKLFKKTFTQDDRNLRVCSFGVSVYDISAVYNERNIRNLS